MQCAAQTAKNERVTEKRIKPRLHFAVARLKIDFASRREFTQQYTCFIDYEIPIWTREKRKSIVRHRDRRMWNERRQMRDVKSWIRAAHWPSNWAFLSHGTKIFSSNDPLKHKRRLSNTASCILRPLRRENYRLKATTKRQTLLTPKRKKESSLFES